MWPKSYDSKRWWTYRIWAVVPRRLSDVLLVARFSLLSVLLRSHCCSHRSIRTPVRTTSPELLFVLLHPNSCPHRSVRIPVRTASPAAYPMQMRTATAPPRDSHEPPQPTARLARCTRCGAHPPSERSSDEPALALLARTSHSVRGRRSFHSRTTASARHSIRTASVPPTAPPAAVSEPSRRSVGSCHHHRAFCRADRLDREAWRSLTFGRVKWSSAKRRPVTGQ